MQGSSFLYLKIVEYNVYIVYSLSFFNIGYMYGS